MTNLTHYRKFLRNNGYPIPADPRDVVHTVRAIMRVRFPCGWRESFGVKTRLCTLPHKSHKMCVNQNTGCGDKCERSDHYKRQGGVVLSGVEQNEGE